MPLDWAGNKLGKIKRESKDSKYLMVLVDGFYKILSACLEAVL
jgi:hypothetical protein